MTYSLQSLSQMAADIASKLREGAEADVRKLATRVFLRFEHDMPRRTGRAGASAQPYVGQEPTEAPPAGQPFYPLLGENVADAIFAGWKLGDHLGVAATVPYARRLAHGWSPQRSDGWVEALIADEIAKARSAR